MKSFTNLRDLDRELLLKFDDKDFLIACNSSKYLRENVCDENFFKRRLFLTYPDSLNYNIDNKSWKQYYIETIYYIAKMKEQNYYYTFGNPKKQYKILKSYTNITQLLFDASEQGELALVITALERGVNINAQGSQALILASFAGQLQIVKYLIEKGAHIHANDNEALRSASFSGHLEIVKYLVEKGADVHANNNEALRLALENKHLDIVKYLQSF